MAYLSAPGRSAKIDVVKPPLPTSWVAVVIDQYRNKRKLKR